MYWNQLNSIILFVTGIAAFSFRTSTWSNIFFQICYRLFWELPTTGFWAFRSGSVGSGGQDAGACIFSCPLPFVSQGAGPTSLSCGQREQRPAQAHGYSSTCRRSPLAVGHTAHAATDGSHCQSVICFEIYEQFVNNLTYIL